MAIPTVTEVEEFKTDIDATETFVNSTAETVATRLGGTKPTLSGIVAQSLVATVTTHSALTQYTSQSQWVEESGAIYRPLPSALPIGPEAFDSSKWVIFQPYRIVPGNGAINLVGGFGGNSIATGANVRSNTISGGGYTATINQIDGDETRYATIGGGYDNHIDGVNSTTDIDGAASTIAGGAHHLIQCTHATIGGGSYGTIGPGCDYGTIGGGTQNEITGAYGSIPGGLGNTAGEYSFSAGRNCTVSASGSVGFCKTVTGSDSYTLDVNGSFGGDFDNYFFTGGNSGFGAYGASLLPTSRVDVKPESDGATAIRVRNALNNSVILSEVSAGGAGGIGLADSAGSRKISIQAGGTSYFNGGSVVIGLATATTNSILRVSGLAEYADDTAAASAGLLAGDFYRTSTGQVMVRF